MYSTTIISLKSHISEKRSRQIQTRDIEGPIDHIRTCICSPLKMTFFRRHIAIESCNMSFPAYFRDKKFHITALEVIAIIVCLKLLDRFFKGKRIVVFCDNMAACQCISTGKARCRILQDCLREICFLPAGFKFEIKLQHLDSGSSRIADHLS